MGRQNQKEKLEQIKKLFRKQEFRQAHSLCEEVDWRKIKSVSTLFMGSDVYKSVGDWEKALTCLEYAYDRAPVGKYILYQLADLALSVGQKSRASEYLEEYQQIAPQDSNLLILNYRLGKLNGDSPDKLIPMLKQYLTENLDEQWSYELAELYAQNKQLDECIKQCDYIILWFSVGEYVDKAIALKEHYASLSEEEIEKRDNKEKYRMRLKQVELDFRSPEDIQILTNRKEKEKEEERLAEKGIVGSKVKLSDVSDLVSAKEKEEKKDDESATIIAKPPQTFSQGEMRERFEQIKTMIRQERTTQRKYDADEKEQVQENESTADSDEETTHSDAKPADVQESENFQEKEQPDKTESQADVQRKDDLVWHFAIRCVNPDRGFDYAQKRINELKVGHEKEYPEETVTFHAMELNLNDMLASRTPLCNRTVVIDYIGEMVDERVHELTKFLMEEAQTQFVFLDYPERLERFLRSYPDLTAQLNHVEDMIVYDVDSLLDYAKAYANDRDYVFHEKAIPILDQVIKQILLEKNEDSKEKLEQFLSEVIEESEEKTLMQTLRNVLFVRYDKENRLILKREDLTKIIKKKGQGKAE